MERIEQALNSVGFLMATARITNGNLRLQFLKNTYRGNKNNIEVRANGWHIGELLEDDDNYNVENLIKLCKYWKDYEKRTKNFYDGLSNLLEADTGDFQRIKNFTGDLLEDDEVIDKFISKIYTGCTYIQNKMEKAKQMTKAFRIYETKGKALKLVQRQLDKQVLTEREAAEKAREVVELEDEFLTKAEQYYKLKADEETSKALQLVLRTEVRARKPEVNWDTISLAVTELDYAGVMIYEDLDIDVNDIQAVATVSTKIQGLVRTILDLESRTASVENEQNRKKKLFYDDLRDILEEIESEPPEEIREIAVMNDLVDRFKEIESTFKDLRRSIDNFPTECDLDGETIDIKTTVQKTKVDLLTAKDKLTTRKNEEKENKKTKESELSKALGKIEIAKLRNGRDFLLWSHSVDQFLKTVEGLDETRVAMTVLNSIEHKPLKRALEGESDLGIIIEAVKLRFQNSDDIISTCTNHLMKLKDPETINQACYNSQEISRSLLQLSRVEIQDQISREMLLNLERKSFAPEHRNIYLMKKMEAIERKETKPGTSCSSSYGERFNLMSGIKKKVSKSSIKEEVEFYSNYLNEYIATTRYMIAQDKAVDRRPKRSPNPKRKPPKSSEEEPGASPRVFNIKKPPMKSCPLGCQHLIEYGSVEFCTGFQNKQVPERKKLVKAKHLCIQCLKLKTTHEGRKCRAPPCKKCKSMHHWMICDSANDQIQIFKTKSGNSDEDDDNEDGNDDDEDNVQEDLDDMHIRYLLTQESPDNGSDEPDNIESDNDSSSEEDLLTEVKEEEDPANCEKEHEVIKQLKTMQKPKKKKQLTDEWWNSVIGIKPEVDATSEKIEDQTIVVSGPTNIRLFLSKETGTNSQEDNENIVRIDKVNSQLIDRQGEIEKELVEDLQKVKHKWPDNYSSSRIEEKYQCPDSDEGNAEDSILIGRDCVNQQLYETILKLSVLMYQKYGTTRGMVVRAKMVVPSINFLDKDVRLVNRTKEGSNIQVNVCLDTGADLDCLQKGFLQSVNVTRLKDQHLTVVTVNGNVKQSYSRHKIQLCRKSLNKLNIAALTVNEIGYENEIRDDFLESIQGHFGFDKQILDKIGRASGKIHVLLGANNAMLFSTPILSKGLGGLHHVPWLSGIAFYRTPFNDKIEIFGRAGTNPELVDDTFPEFVVPKILALENTETSMTQEERLKTTIPEQPVHVTEDDEETEGEMLMNVRSLKVDYEELQKFLESEGKPEIFRRLCQNCMKYSKKCNQCATLNRALSLEDQEWLGRFWTNTKLIQFNGSPRIKVDMPYKNPVETVFRPENSNFKSAFGAAKRVARSLYKKPGDLKEYIEQIEKGKSQGMLIRLSQSEVESLKTRPHFFTHHGVVYKPNSLSTSVRLVNNTAILVRGATTTLNIECPAVASYLNKLESCIIHFLLYDHPLAADLKTAYRQILVDEKTSYLRLCIWFETVNIPGCDQPIIMRRVTLDFGDPSAGVVLEVSNRKVGSGACVYSETKDLICDRRFVDNLGDSFRTKNDYDLIRQDMMQAYAKIGLPVKECISKIETDPDCLKNAGRDSEIVSMMGMDWNTRTDTITPSIYVSRFEKKRGQPLGTPLHLDETISVTDISRLTLSRIVPQLYDPLGAHLGILKAQGKMLLSRSCQLAELHQLQTPLIELDADFGQLVFNWIIELKGITRLEPRKRALVRGTETLVGLTCHVDGGVAGYGAVVYITVRLSLNDPRLVHRILLSKSRVSRRNVVLHECLSKLLGIRTVLMAAEPLSTRSELEDAGLIIVIATDSICSALTFKPGLQLKNTLVRNAVDNCLHGAQDLLQMFPMCTIHFTWIPGTMNCADPLTKLLPDPIRLLNGSTWQNGSRIMQTMEDNTSHTFLKIDCEGAQYLGLPEEITKIEQNRTKLLEARGSDKFDNRDKVVKCLRCDMEEEYCGILLTRAQAKLLDQQAAVHPWPPGASSPSPPAPKVIPDNIRKLFMGYNLDGVENLITSGPEDTQVTAFDHDFYISALAKYSHFLPFFFYLCHLIRWFVRTNESGNFTQVMARVWRKILITSQQLFAPSTGKNVNIIKFCGIQCISFRLIRDDALRLFGSDILPLISEKDPLLMKLLRFRHSPPRNSTAGIHESQLGTTAALQKGKFGFFHYKMKQLVAEYTARCKNCNVDKEVRYSQVPLGPCSTKIAFDAKVFSQISIDPLAGIHIHPFSGGRNLVEVFPLMIACKITGGLDCVMMDGMKTKNILLALQELEARYSPIQTITCDAGKNLVNISVESLNSGEKKLLSKLEMVNHTLPDSQRRNYVERRIQTFKSYMRSAFCTPRRNALPILSHQELTTTIRKVLRHINQIPFTISAEGGLISPATFIYPGAALSELDCGPEMEILQNFKAAAVKIQQHLDAFMNIRNNYFISAKRLLTRQLPLRGQKKGPTGAQISENDIVMINPGGKYNQGRFGIVQKLLSNHTAEILTRERGVENVAIANIYALIPQHLNMNLTPHTTTTSQ